MCVRKIPSHYRKLWKMTIVRNYMGDGGLDNLTNALTSETFTPAGSDTALGMVSYEYDPAGRRLQMSVTGQASAVDYTWDEANRSTQIVQGTSTVGLGYDPANRRTSLSPTDRWRLFLRSFSRLTRPPDCNDPRLRARRSRSLFSPWGYAGIRWGRGRWHAAPARP